MSAENTPKAEVVVGEPMRINALGKPSVAWTPEQRKLGAFTVALPHHLAAEQQMIEAGLIEPPTARRPKPQESGIEHVVIISSGTAIVAPDFDIGPIRRIDTPDFDLGPIREIVPDFEIRPRRIDTSGSTEGTSKPPSDPTT